MKVSEVVISFGWSPDSIRLVKLAVYTSCSQEKVIVKLNHKRCPSDRPRNSDRLNFERARGHAFEDGR